MPNTRITRQRWKDHMYYGKWIYILLAIVAFFVTDLLYSVTAYRPPDERKVTFQFVSGGAVTAEGIQAFEDEVFQRVAPKDETLEAVEIFTIAYSGEASDYYGAQKFMVELAAGENDIYIGSKLLVSSIIDQGAALPLEDYIESGLLAVPEGAELLYRREPVYDDEGNDTGTGEQRIYGFSTAPMVQMPYYTYMDNSKCYFVLTAMSGNPETSLLAWQELFDLWSQPLELETEGAEGGAAATAQPTATAEAVAP